MKVDNLTSLIDERDREVQNIVASINELAQVRLPAGDAGGCTLASGQHSSLSLGTQPTRGVPALPHAN